jgi:hypothetical protein
MEHKQSGNVTYHRSRLLIGWILPVLLVFAGSCGKKSATSDEKILVRIGDSSISVNEFIRRAEYTIRPRYCRRDNYIHRKIVLNSLIAEKLLAKESGEKNPLTGNAQFQDYIRGRREQAMRQWFYYNEFYKPVRLDSQEVRNTLSLSSRSYRVSYFSLEDSIRARNIEEQLQRGIPFDSLFQRVGYLGELPERQVAWGDPDHPAVKKALFLGRPVRGDVIGPVKISNRMYMFMKVTGWTDRIEFSDRKARERMKDVEDWLRTTRAAEAFESSVGELMRGKRIEFNPDVFRKLTPIFGAIYFRSDREKEEAFNQNFWRNDRQSMQFDPDATGIEEIRDQSLLTIDGEVWTVRRLEEELRVHPLVFRKKRMPKNEFAEQFKFAIADLIRDKYITEEAYERGYDKVDVVRRNVRMWRDNLLFMYQRNRFLDSLGQSSRFKTQPEEIIKAHLNSYVDSLQMKYAPLIEIDTDSFEAIELTNIDLFVIQENVPYPVIVPGFPVITTDDKLDYGRKMGNPDG